MSESRSSSATVSVSGRREMSPPGVRVVVEEGGELRELACHNRNGQSKIIWARVPSIPGALDECKVRDVGSTLSVARVLTLALEYHIPADYWWCAPEAMDRAMAPPAGFVTVYEESLRAGLRYPLAPIFLNIQEFFRIPICQFTPNSIRSVIGLGLASHSLGEKLSLDLLLRFFSVKSSHGVYYFSPRQHFKVSAPSKVAWPKKFFFLQVGGGPFYEWRTGKVSDPKLEPLGSIEDQLNMLAEVPDAYTEAELSDAGLRFSRVGAEGSGASRVKLIKSKKAGDATTASRSESPISKPPPAKRMKSAETGRSPEVVVDLSQLVTASSRSRTEEAQLQITDVLQLPSTPITSPQGVAAAVRELARIAGNVAESVEKEKAASDAALKEKASALEAAQAEVDRLKADLKKARADAGKAVAKARELAEERKAVLQGQGPMLRTFTDKLIQSESFSAFISRLADVLKPQVVAQHLEKLEEQMPGFDKKKHGWAEVEPAELEKNYARILAEAGSFPVVETLAASTSFLTEEVVKQCREDEDAELQKLLAEVRDEHIAEPGPQKEAEVS